MKKFIAKTIFFIFISLITYLLVLYGISFTNGNLINNYSNLRGKGFSHIRFAEVDDFGPVDVLFLGSSHSYRGFDTSFFSEQGITCFNLGSSSQTPIQSLFLLKRYYNELKPKYIIMDIYPVIYSLDGIESSLDLLFNDKIGLDSLRLVFDSFSIKTVNAFFISFFQQNRGGLPDNEYIHNKDIYVSGGYVKREINNNKLPEIKNLWVLSS
jgi:hypothetical protein